MLRKVFYALLVLAFVFSANSFSFAQGNNTTTSESESVNVGNKICPVTGEKIDEQNKATYEYEGKIYNFCCPMCIEEFKKDPEKYIKKIEEEKTKEESKQEEPLHEEHPHSH